MKQISCNYHINFLLTLMVGILPSCAIIAMQASKKPFEIQLQHLKIELRNLTTNIPTKDPELQLQVLHDAQNLYERLSKLDVPDGGLFEEIIKMRKELNDISDEVSSALARRRYETEHLPAAIYLPSLPKTLIDMETDFNELIENVDYLTKENDPESVDPAIILQQKIHDFLKKYHWIIDNRSIRMLTHKLSLFMNNLSTKQAL